MKNKGLIIFLISFLTIFVIALTVFFIALLKGDIKYSSMINVFNSTSDEVIAEKTFENEFDLISIKADRSEIEFKHSDDEKIKVIVYGNKKEDKVIYDNKNSKLEIELKQKKCRFLCVNKENGKIVVYLPQTYDKSLKAENDTGSITLEKYEKASVEIKSDVGEINIKEINEIKAKSDVGEINIDKVNSKINIESDVGAVNIKEANLTKDSKINTDVGDIKIKKIFGVNIDSKNDVGKNKVNKNDKSSSVTLTIRSDVGSIEIN